MQSIQGLRDGSVNVGTVVDLERFARELSQRLDRGVDNHQFDRLIIAAPPTFLGRLRRELSGRVRQRVVLDLDADYSNVPIRDLPSRVPVL